MGDSGKGLISRDAHRSFPPLTSRRKPVRTATVRRARSGAPRGEPERKRNICGEERPTILSSFAISFHLITELLSGLLLDVPNAQENGSIGLYAGRFGLLS